MGVVLTDSNYDGKASPTDQCSVAGTNLLRLKLNLLVFFKLSSIERGHRIVALGNPPISYFLNYYYWCLFVWVWVVEDP